LYGAKNWALCIADQKYLESFERRCCRRMEKTSSDFMKNEYYTESRRRGISYI
jgi:hypothetical protein